MMCYLKVSLNKPSKTDETCNWRRIGNNDAGQITAKNFKATDEYFYGDSLIVSDWLYIYSYTISKNSSTKFQFLTNREW